MTPSTGRKQKAQAVKVSGEGEKQHMYNIVAYAKHPYVPFSTLTGYNVSL